jgi:hypothetical protein
MREQIRSVAIVVGVAIAAAFGGGLLLGRAWSRS